MADFDGIEIPDDLLDAVTGGAVTPAKRKDLVDLMRYLKSHDIVKSKVIEFFTQNVFADEAAMGLISELYDTL